MEMNTSVRLRPGFVMVSFSVFTGQRAPRNERVMRCTFVVVEFLVSVIVTGKRVEQD